MYPSLTAFFVTHGLPCPRKGDWRLVDPPVPGHVNGLPTSSGLLVATDGVMGWIVRHDGSLFFGHSCEWVADDIVRTSTQPRKRGPVRKASPDYASEMELYQ